MNSTAKYKSKKNSFHHIVELDERAANDSWTDSLHPFRITIYPIITDIDIIEIIHMLDRQLLVIRRLAVYSISTHSFTGCVRS